MVKTIARAAFACSILLACAAPALAHHSAAAYDTAKEVRVTGTVLQYRFANPHVYLTLQVKNPDGSTTKLEIEAGAASVLNGLGFTKDSVTPGEVVTVVGNPDRKNPAFVLGKDLFKRDGKYVPLNIASRSVYQEKNETAASIAGTWFRRARSSWPTWAPRAAGVSPTRAGPRRPISIRRRRRRRTASR